MPDPQNPKNWNKIAAIIASVMANGNAEPYKSVMKKSLEIGGKVVEVTYKVINGVAKISDAWVK